MVMLVTSGMVRYIWYHYHGNFGSKYLLKIVLHTCQKR